MLSHGLTRKLSFITGLWIALFLLAACANGGSSPRTYDEILLPSKVTYYTSGELFSVTDIDYDDKGNATGWTITYTNSIYDPIKVAYKSTDYDEYGNLLISEGNTDYECSYSKGHTTKMNNDQWVVTYEYHDNGLRKTVTQAKGADITEFHYDEDGYLTKIVNRGGDLAGTYNYQWEKDSEGKPLSCSYDDYYTYLIDTIGASVAGSSERPSVQLNKKTFRADENGNLIYVYGADGTVEQEIEYVHIESPNEHAWEVANTYGYEKLDGLYPITWP